MRGHDPNFGMTPEEVAAFAHGEDEAWNRFYEPAFKSLYGYFWSLGFSPHDAEDRAEDTLAVFLETRRYDPSKGASLSGWLLGGAYYQAQNAWRERGDVPKGAAEEVLGEASAGAVGENLGDMHGFELEVLDATPLDEKLFARFQQTYAHALETLRPREREYFPLYVRLESPKEVAEACDVPLSTVEAPITRARQRILEALRADGFSLWPTSAPLPRDDAVPVYDLGTLRLIYQPPGGSDEH